MSQDVVNILDNLIRKKSITPNDDGCQEYIYKELKDFGFDLKDLSENGIVNSLIFKSNNKGPKLLFAGHTDVVPPGDESLWKSDPFTPIIENNIMTGRGCSDMKGSIACMVTAIKKFVNNYPDFNGAIGILLTSDEEGPAKYGTKVAVEKMKSENLSPNYTIVGEPTSSSKLGDTIKNGRRGSITCILKIKGIQGHIAYPELAKNPNHITFNIMQDLLNYKWDQGNEHFPKTSFQVSSVTSDNVAENMIPAWTKIIFNLRFSNETNEDEIKSVLENIISKYECDYEANWNCSAQPFLTKEGELTTVLKESIKEISDIDTTLSTNGGTSDARFLSKISGETVEFGLINESAHKANECVNLDDLANLEKIYYNVIERLLCK